MGGGGGIPFPRRGPLFCVVCTALYAEVRAIGVLQVGREGGVCVCVCAAEADAGGVGGGGGDYDYDCGLLLGRL